MVYLSGLYDMLLPLEWMIEPQIKRADDGVRVLLVISES